VKNNHTRFREERSKEFWKIWTISFKAM